MSETRDLQFTLEEKEISGMQVDIYRWDGEKLCRLSVYEWGSSEAKRPYGCIDVRVSPGQQIEVQAWKEGEPILSQKLLPEMNSVSITIHTIQEAKQDKPKDDKGDVSSSDTATDSSL